MLVTDTEPLNAVVMAAGKGTRLRPLTAGIPKPLLPIKGKAMLEWAIKNVMSISPNNIYIAISGTTVEEFQDRVLSYVHGVCVEYYIRSLNYTGINMKTIPTMQRETAGDLKQVLEDTNTYQGDLLVAYGDVLTDIDLKKALDYHTNCKRDLDTYATMILFEVPQEEAKRFGIAKLKK
jgi:NDP-sugar pyrophosphorylase family protein